MNEQHRTIKIKYSTYRALKVLAAERGEAMLDLIDRLVVKERSIAMNEQRQFQQAIADRDWFTATRMVMDYTAEPTTDEHGADELQDWLSTGDWDGAETPQSVASEWDMLSRSARDL